MSIPPAFAFAERLTGVPGETLLSLASGAVEPEPHQKHLAEALRAGWSSADVELSACEPATAAEGDVFALFDGPAF